ncbi:hypothetical protein ABK040_015414 [Willaertia magna]
MNSCVSEGYIQKIKFSEIEKAIEKLKGISLCEEFYKEIINPLLSQYFNNFSENHAACLIGYGSEVLGFDTNMSKDHDFAPRVILLLKEEYFNENKESMNEILDENIPDKFMGIDCRLVIEEDPFSFVPNVNNDSNNDNISTIVKKKGKHLVQITTIKEYFTNYLDSTFCNEENYCDWFCKCLDTDFSLWLRIPQQKLLTVGQAGKIFHDGFGELSKIKEKLNNYYPDSVWLYQLMIQSSRISQEAAFVGRTGIVGDSLGCLLQCSKIVKDIMSLCFLMERKYQPYSKWFGTAFKKLQLSTQLENVLLKSFLINNNLEEFNWKLVELELEKAYKIIVKAFNENVINYLKNKWNINCNEVFNEIEEYKIVHQFWDRPFVVFDSEIITKKCKLLINCLLENTDKNDNVKQLNENLFRFIEKSTGDTSRNGIPTVGAIDQTVYQVEFLESTLSNKVYGELFFK